MQLETVRVPWTGAGAFRVPSARRVLVELCGSPGETFLPVNIDILLDGSFDSTSVRYLLEPLAAQLVREMIIWQRRLSELCDTGLIAHESLTETCAALRAAQHWYICASAAGGLMMGADSVAADGDPERSAAGLIPCSAVTHHGVAWWRDANGARSVGLVTAHAVGGRWNWDEDIGHESAHAAFGPVPLFTQTLEANGFSTPFAQALQATGERLTSALIARTAYMISEITVAFIRGEQRPTVVGLPGLHSFDDLSAFVEAAHTLFPTAGFPRARDAALQEGIPLKVWSGESIRLLGVAAFRSARSLIPLINRTHPPSSDEFRSWSA